MRIGFVVERPTQFEAPFFRFAAGDPAHELRVFFTDPAAGRAIRDPELGRVVDWGLDLLQGYGHETAPASAGARWWSERLGAACVDLLVVNGYTRSAYLRAAACGRRSARRVGLRIDTVLFDRRPSVVRRLLVSRVLTCLFDRFLATGTLARRYLDDCGVPAAQVGLFPYAIDVPSFRAGGRLEPEARQAVRVGFGLTPDAKLVLAVAKLSPREAPWELLRAAASLRAPGVQFLVAGDGPVRPELERFVREVGLDGVVRFSGYVPYRELPRLYGAADLFVHAPREERWGVSVAEALAAGLPVVASSRVGSAHDLIAPGAGYLYPAGREDQLADCIRRALDLDPRLVAAAATARLTEWDYAATWRHLLAAAA